MKHIYVNFKRFDIPAERGGVNRLAPIAQWGESVTRQTQAGLTSYSGGDVEFVHFLPEAHLLPALDALDGASPLAIGAQGVYREDVAPGGNFGAFTTNRPAQAVAEMGCTAVIIGHCEERRDLEGVLAEAGVADKAAVNRILNKEIRCAQAAGLEVLYCVGEGEDEVDRWQEVIALQLDTGLEGANLDRVVVAYEPIWSIGPGKTPAGKDHIQKIARFVKATAGNVDVVYGGGLKQDNAGMLASIPEIDGGLIALTRFAGEIGFYPEEYLEIVRLYLEKSN